jgi:putative acetyltransferase
MPLKMSTTPNTSEDQTGAGPGSKGLDGLCNRTLSDVGNGLPNAVPEMLVACAPEHLAAIRELFTEYSDSLEISLCFQNFREELANLPGAYGPPGGRLMLAIGAGCVALRPIDDSTCEMKRLFVRPQFRRSGLGRRLALAAVAAARELGYERMRLDTLSSMEPAIALYHSLGFSEIPPYYHNPNLCAVFMELAL